MVFTLVSIAMVFAKLVSILCKVTIGYQVRFDKRLIKFMYRIVASTSPSRIEAHAGIFRSLMKGIFDPYVL